MCGPVAGGPGASPHRTLAAGLSLIFSVGLQGETCSVPAWLPVLSAAGSDASRLGSGDMLPRGNTWFAKPELSGRPSPFLRVAVLPMLGFTAPRTPGGPPPGAIPCAEGGVSADCG